MTMVEIKIAPAGQGRRRRSSTTPPFAGRHEPRRAARGRPHVRGQPPRRDRLDARRAPRSRARPRRCTARRARAAPATATARRPSFRGGGVAHGPHPRDYSYSHAAQGPAARPARSRSPASCATARSLRWEGDVLPRASPRPRRSASSLAALGAADNALIVAPGPVDQNLLLSVRNLPRVRALPAAEVSRLRRRRATTGSCSSTGPTRRSRAPGTGRRTPRPRTRKGARREEPDAPGRRAPPGRHREDARAGRAQQHLHLRGPRERQQGPDPRRRSSISSRSASTDVRTQRYLGKRRRMGAYVGSTGNWKKAIVRVKEGDTIDFY